MLSTVTQDLRLILRGFGRRPVYATVTILTLALGIGCGTAVFGLVDAVLWRPLAFTNPAQLVSVWPDRLLSNREVKALRERMQSFAAVATLSPGWGVALTDVDEPTQLLGARTSANLFEVLGVAPELGRTFVPSDGVPGAEDVVLLNSKLWRTTFGERRDIVGSRLVLDGTPHTVVGVLPPEFELFQPDTDLWQPIPEDPTAWYHRSGIFLAVARLTLESTIAVASAELRSVLPGIREELALPDDYGRDAVVMDLRQNIVGDAKTTLLIVAIAVACMLLLASANIGSLQLVRAIGRAREMAVRRALGAPTGRLVRLLLTESVLLTAAGGALGWLIAMALLRFAAHRLPLEFPRVGELVVDGRLLLGGLIVTAVVGAMCGILPALAAVSRSANAATLRMSPTSDWRLALRTRGFVVVVQMAFALVLVIGAGLMVQTLATLQAVDAGFTRTALTMRVQPTGSRYRTADQRLAYYRDLFSSIAAVPHVEAVGAIQHLPLSGVSWGADLEIEGTPLVLGETPPRAGWRVVNTGYFDAMGIRLLTGRVFTDADHRDASPVVVVSNRLAERHWPGGEALGRRVRAGNATGNEWATVIGVVSDVRHAGLDAEWTEDLYRPVTQYPHGSLALVVRTSVDPLSLGFAIREAVWSVDGGVPISEVRTLENVIGASMGRRRLLMVVLLAFAGITLIMGGLGVYGVVTSAVTQRSREIGVRMALGADRIRVMIMVLKQGLVFGALGVATGTLGAIALTRVLHTFLFGVKPTHPPTFVVLGFALLVLTLLASYLPARRAASVDPVIALTAD